MDDKDENAPIKRKRGRPPKVKTPPVNAEIQEPKPHYDGRANLKPGGKLRRHIRKDVAKHLDQLGFNPLTEMVKLYKDPRTPSKVRFDVTRELLSYCSVKPKHQLQSENVNALTELFALVAGDGRPLPPTALVFDGEASVVEDEPDDEEPEGDE